MTRVYLGDICDFINGGAWSDKEYVEDGIPVLKVTNCKTDSFSLEDIDYLPLSAANTYAQHRLCLHDVVIATVGSHPTLEKSAAGRAVIINDSVQGFYLNQNAVCLRSKSETVLNQRYLGYLARSFEFRNFIQMRGRGAANQMRIAIGSIKQFEFQLPDIHAQRRIADILSAYDDLIENNQKQIKLLEEAAQRLYREWFVDLRFPGHETTPVVDGVPEGWEWVSLGNIVDYEIGGGWGEEEPTAKADIPAYVIRGTDIYGITHGEILDIPHRYHPTSNLSSRRLQPGDIVFEVSGGSRTEGVAKTLLITDAMLESWDAPVICASFCKLMRFPTPMIAQYIFDMLQYMRSIGKTEEFEKKSASSIINYRWKDFLEQMDVLLPSTELLQHYAEVAGELYNAIVVCSRKIEAAKKARDRLLPKLMSGDVEV